jgi:AraC-like DNA-binding protein
LLEDPDAKILDIAFQLGYSDPAHFTRAFRKWTSISPNAYRELMLCEQVPPAHLARPSSLSSVGLPA